MLKKQGKSPSVTSDAEFEKCLSFYQRRRMRKPLDHFKYAWKDIRCYSDVRLKKIKGQSMDAVYKTVFNIVEHLIT